MGREFELKYRADGEKIAAIRAQYGIFAPITMKTAYYDTPDLKLSMRRWTLRRRLENETSVCTAKIPLEDGSRGEWEVEENSLMAAIPKLCKLGAPMELMILGVNGMVQLCGAEFTRLAATVTLPEAEVELALDQGILFGGNRQLPFAEVEVELKSGSEEAAVAFAQKLAQQFGLEAEPASKFQRARALVF